MPTGSLFGSSYDYGSSPSQGWTAADVPAWGAGYQIGLGQVPGPVAVGDVLEVVGWGAGLVVDIIGGIARIQNEGGEVIEVVVTPPPTPPPTDWTPVLVGGGLLLALVLVLGRR
jgi:hypothetical protein